MNKKEKMEVIFKKISDSRNQLLELYSREVISVPWSDKWRDALPENYTNYQDGFIYENCEPYRGMPFVRYNSVILYLRYIVPWHILPEDVSEQYLLFDRYGNKYTYTILDAPEEEKKNGNPSYYIFLPRVKKYSKEIRR